MHKYYMLKKRNKKTSRHTKQHHHSSPSFFLSKKFILIFGTLACLLGIIFFATKHITSSSASSGSCLGYNNVEGECILKQFCNDDESVGHCVLSQDCKPVGQERCYVLNNAPTVTPTPYPRCNTAPVWNSNAIDMCGFCEIGGYYTKYNNYPTYEKPCTQTTAIKYQCMASGPHNQGAGKGLYTCSAHNVIYPKGDNGGYPGGECAYCASGTSAPSYVSVSGRIFVDNIRTNGLWDSGESAYGGRNVTVVLSWGSGASQRRTVTSDSSGWYRFDNIQTNFYTITVTPPSTYRVTDTNPLHYNANKTVSNLNFGIVRSTKNTQ